MNVHPLSECSRLLKASGLPRSVATLRADIGAGKLKAQKIGRAYLVSPPDLAAYAVALVIATKGATVRLLHRALLLGRMGSAPVMAVDAFEILVASLPPSPPVLSLVPKEDSAPSVPQGVPGDPHCTCLVSPEEGGSLPSPFIHDLDCQMAGLGEVSHGGG